MPFALELQRSALGILIGKGIGVTLIPFAQGIGVRPIPYK